jgi:heat shock protein HslJ
MIMKRFSFLLLLITLLVSCNSSKIDEKATVDSSSNDKLALTKESITYRDNRFRDSGIDFVAFGTYPSWILMIDKTKKILSFQLEGEEKVNLSLESIEYIDIMELHAANDSINIEMTLMEQHCIDYNTSEIMPLKVHLEFNGKAFNGCGKNLRQHDQEPITVDVRINDIWALEAVDAKTLDFSNKSFYRPTLEIHLNKMIARGLTGCNNFQASFIVDGNNIEFPPFNMTQKFCEGYETIFVKGISRTASYKIENMKLFFFDKEGKEVLRFKKVD